MNNYYVEPNFDEDIDRRAVPALKTHSRVVGENHNSLFAAGVADMDFRAPPPVLAALQQRLDHGVFGYETLPEGLIPALMNWLHKRHGWDVPENQILRAPNVLNSLAIAASTFTDKGDSIIVQPPVFFDFYDIIMENHRKLAPNPLILRDGRYEMDFDGLEQIASDSKSKMLFLCNPHNPVGRVWSRDDLMLLGDICRRNNVVVVADEIHSDITFPGHKYIPFASLGPEYAKNAISFISPAKSFNIASCCSSFTIISDEEKRNAFNVENSRLTVNKNNAFASVAMEAAYREGEFWLNAVIEYLDHNLALVRERLSDTQKVRLIEPEGTFLLWLDFRELKMSADELKKFLTNQAGWAVTQGKSFGGEGTGFVRLNIACPRFKLDNALNQLSTAVQ